MKKLLLAFAFVAVYGLSIAAPVADVSIADETQIAFVQDVADNDAAATEEGKKEEKKAAKTEAKASGDAKAKSEGCAGEAKKECASACGEKKK